MNSQSVRNFLKNKKLVAASILGLTIISLSVFSNKGVSNPLITETKQEEQGVLVINGGVNDSVADLINKDSDKDGLKDWEEALYGTDPNNKDSNNNGILDGTEVHKQNVAKNTTSGEITTSATDQFGQQFFVAASALKNAGKFDPETVRETAKIIYSNIKQEEIRPLYTINDLTVIKNASDAEILAYSKNLGTVIQKYSKYNLGQEITVISTSLETSDQTLQTKLVPYINAYTNIAKDTVEIAVPEKIAELHLDLINNYRGTADSLKIVGQIFSDPLLSMNGLNQYLSYSNKLVETAKTLEIYFKSGVILNNTQP
ncbi:MAG: thrombospondin type 3 repeat-containing protein [Candidatus Paceibacterota bacterium]|jgi:hypothetical protein